MPVIDNAVYVDGPPHAGPGVPGRDVRGAARPRGAWRGSACTGRTRPRSASVAAEFELHELPVRTRSRPTSGRSSSGTATPCSWCCGRPATSTTSRRSSSASCTCSSAPNFVITVRHAESPDLARVRRPAGGQPGAARPAARGGALRDPRPGRRRVRPGGRRAGERHRRDRGPALRAATRRCPGGSTSCPGEVIEFQRATQPLPGMLRGAAPRVRQVRRRRGAAAQPARRRRPRDAVVERGDAFRELLQNALDGERHPRRAAAERGDAVADRGQPGAERGGQEDLRLGGDPVRARP